MLPALVECVKQSGNVRGPVSPGAPVDARTDAQRREAMEKVRAAMRERNAGMFARARSAMS